MKAFHACLAVMASFVMTTSLHATALLNENFDELTPALGVMSAGSFHTINGTNVDVVGQANGFGFLCAAPEGGNCIDMDGSGGNPVGQLQSNMLFGAGSYLLSFDLIGSGRGVSSATTVSFGSYSQTFNLASTDTTTGIVSGQMVTLTSPGYLLFVSNDPSGSVQGDVLDNVIVATTTTAATPEPNGFFLLGTGLIGIATVVRKRFA